MFKKSFLLVFIAIILICSFFIWWLSVTGPVDPKNKEPVDFNITSGQGVKTIASNLEEKGLIKDTNAFLLYIRFSGLGGKIQAGNFQLTPSMSMPELASQLTHGVDDIWIKIIEGWRVEEIAQYLEENLGIDQNEFIANSREGYMFPDSYRISAGSSGADIANIMKANFDNKIDDNIKNKAASQGLTLHETVTLASILEREVKNAADRPVVAGIFLKRIQNGWPLQADATVQYTVGFSNQEGVWWKKQLTADDLQIDSPYNTYVVTGLPPGPIANPGIATIKAVVEPKDSQYWYYVSDQTGKLHFAATIEEHEANITRYLH